MFSVGSVTTFGGRRTRRSIHRRRPNQFVERCFAVPSAVIFLVFSVVELLPRFLPPCRATLYIRDPGHRFPRCRVCPGVARQGARACCRPGTCTFPIHFDVRAGFRSSSVFIPCVLMHMLVSVPVSVWIPPCVVLNSVGLFRLLSINCFVHRVVRSNFLGLSFFCMFVLRRSYPPPPMKEFSCSRAFFRKAAFSIFVPPLSTDH